MTTQTLIRQLNKEIITLRKDVSDIKQFIFEAFYDSEGSYRQSFIKKALRRVEEKPLYKFISSKEFLKQVYGK